MAVFTKEFWKNVGTLGIYSTEAEGLLSDQLDSGAPGGANASDADSDSGGGADTSDDDGMDINIDAGDNSSGDMDLGDDSDTGGEDESMGEGDEGTGDSDMDAQIEKDPNINPFKGQNGKALLDDKLAELQAAVTDTLERIYANPKIEHVVVSELENLVDSIRNIRETVFLVPVDATLYKYRLSTTAYKSLAEQICASLDEDN